MLEVEECNRTMLEFRADDSSRRHTKPISVKLQRSFQIVDTDGNHGDSGFHPFSRVLTEAQEGKPD
jgi:hypothetical protein